MDTLAARIKAVRESERLTQQEFADRIGTPRSNIGGYEKGARNPSDAVVALICREFRVNESWLRTGVGEMKAETTQQEKLSRFMGDVLAAAPDERSAFIAALAALPPEFWPVITDLAKDIVSNLNKKED